MTCALLVVSVACTTATSTGESAPASVEAVSPSALSPTGSVEPSASAPVQPGADTVNLDAPPDGSFSVHGSYPHVESACVDAGQPRLGAKYPGRLTVRREDDGSLTLSVSLSFERYLEGIAEVPPSWPRAALEAQAIAARSYALASTGWDGAEGETLGTPICATTSCQVYRGIPLGHADDVERWYRAVRDTRGLSPPPPRESRDDLLLLHVERTDLWQREGVRRHAAAVPQRDRRA